MDSQHSLTMTRREVLQRSALGFGSLAFSCLAAEAGQGSPADRQNALAPKPPPLAPRAKRMIFLFMQGGPSQIDLFDFKASLQRYSGKPMPFALPENYEAPGLQNSRIMAPVSQFRRAGQSGVLISEWLPHLADVMDDICLLRAVHVDSEAHAPAVRQMHTGQNVQIRPSMGSWILYGLGTENQNMPGYITLRPAVTGDGGSPLNFGNGFLPAVYQGTPVGLGGSSLDIRHTDGSQRSGQAQRRELEFLGKLNRAHLTGTGGDAALEGMIQAYELAFRMQANAPELMDLSRESEVTRTAYGLDDEDTRELGQQCLLARKLVESGVRFVEVNDRGWDHHAYIQRDLPKKCRSMDKPVAALLKDLKQRGLLDDTLVLWGGEFGRTPFDQDLSMGKGPEGNRGREHNPNGFTMWMAGGGVRPGMVYGETDDFAYHAVDGKIHLHDLHATILHLLGLEHEKLTYRYAGRDFRLTDVYGRVVKEIVLS